MPWQKGQSGNPAGRPKQEDALRAVLASYGAGRSTGSRQSRNQHAAALLYQLLETGRLELADGRTIEASAREWLRAFAFLCQHLDGPYSPQRQQEIPDDVLDQVLADLAGRADPTAQRAAIAAAFGQLLAALLPLDDPGLLHQARELQRELLQEDADPARLLALRAFFSSQTGEARRAAALFFGCPEVQQLLRQAASRG